LSTATSARALLDELRVVVEPAMRSAVEAMDPVSSAISAYHLGWTEADGTPVASSGGKAVRSGLAVLSAQAAGAHAEIGIPGAVAVELVHNFSLLHDDVIDGDEQRRHRPTVWAIWGVADAILAGDAMLVAAQRALVDAPQGDAIGALRLLQNATQSIIHGQFEDIRFETRQDVTLEECLAMAGRKTSSLLSASAAIGAVLAGAPEATIAALAEFGERLGAAFQLVDDLLGIWGDPSVTGKPVLSDLRSRKKTLPVTYSLSTGRPEAAALRDFLAGTGDAPDDQLAEMARIIEVCGGRDWAMREAQSQIGLAARALDDAGIPEPARGQLIDVAAFVARRDD
jgi:geranylgeranyl diphosphate synthase type I